MRSIILTRCGVVRSRGDVRPNNYGVYFGLLLTVTVCFSATSALLDQYEYVSVGHYLVQLGSADQPDRGVLLSLQSAAQQSQQQLVVLVAPTGHADLVGLVGVTSCRHHSTQGTRNQNSCRILHSQANLFYRHRTHPIHDRGRQCEYPLGSFYCLFVRRVVQSIDSRPINFKLLHIEFM